ncbi:hypothetical protein KL905_003121 [Ogataea polymorpha]|uniref:C2H2-type domain-containing protein n=1 Tax=Ogataea polymorpha TaxID=460523 RepID=A0A9P8PUX1_9ASCO|nr:hypothetical protein KL907_003938 [Ogataea polymorpha]KAG7920487.1 hypothetical protein KL905_003121 [Ogataea polymorpha]KAG7935507.1 hypothetical protein KL934_002066 [Ogataea polymorpha]KAH3678042.1 hypothetical protein OGATHE_000697 [Ogataea polymorpha]
MSLTFNRPGNFTCNSCQIRLPTADVQRIHMKTEWHRYNLLRRVAGLGPIDSVVFQSKVALQQRQEAINSDQDEFGFHVHRKHRTGRRQPTKKDLKRRTRKDILANSSVDRRAQSPAASVVSRASEFSLGSIHSEAQSECTIDDLISEPTVSDYDYTSTASDSETSASEDDYTEEEQEEEPVILTNCFYCSVQSIDEEANVAHMSTAHGLFIPEQDHLVDLSGLLQYLGDRAIIDKECLKCGFVGKNLVSIRQHLQSKGHCVIPYETRAERQVIARFYDFDESEYTTVKVLPNGIELPDGRILGSRSFARYYRQNFPRRDREVGDGERTMSLVVKDREFHAPGYHRPVVEAQREKLSLRQLRKGNNLAHFRDPLN